LLKDVTKASDIHEAGHFRRRHDEDSGLLTNETTSTT